MEGHSTFDNDQLFIDSAGILTIECGQAPRNCDSIIHIPNNHVAPQAIAEAICGRYQLRTPTDSDRQHFAHLKRFWIFVNKWRLTNQSGLSELGGACSITLGEVKKKQLKRICVGTVVLTKISWQSLPSVVSSCRQPLANSSGERQLFSTKQPWVDR